MKKSLLILVALFAFIALSPPAQVSAQGVYIGAGMSIPTSDFSDEHDSGFLGVGGVSFPIGMEGLSVFGEGFWGRNSFSDEDATTNPYGLMGGLLYNFSAEGSPGIYVFGQAGLMVHKYSSDTYEDESNSGLGYGGGAGFNFPMDGVDLWVEARYLAASIEDSAGFSETTAFFGLLAGISLVLGGG